MPPQKKEQLDTEHIKSCCFTKRLPPIYALKVVEGKFFGRNVKADIQRIKYRRRPLRLKLRNKCPVVIIDNESYEELLSLKAKFVELVENMTQSDIAELGNQLVSMASRTSSPQTVSWFKSLRLASPEKFAPRRK